jgi:predicted DNA-binding transcriptional regulator AlpA
VVVAVPVSPHVIPDRPMWRQAHMRTVRVVEIAELLGVTKQRAHQIAEEKGFPAPLAEDASGRVWSRYEVQAWAKRWRREKPWR